MNTSRIGIIGGSGLYDLDGLDVCDELAIETPFGDPSDKLVLARYGDVEVVFLPRHGRGHRIPPHRINYRANIYAMKVAGVREIVSISAVGSLREEIAPGDFVIVDQFVDRTQARAATFFDGPIVAHVSMADPVCRRLRHRLIRACEEVEIPLHTKGTYLVMQGPQFSSRAESELYRRWGMDVIGMTNMPEAKLAREAEICYATVAMCTDYDCWHEEADDVSVASVVEVMHANVDKAKRMLRALLAMPRERRDTCACQCALSSGLFADLKSADDAALRRIYPLVRRLL
ncbi:MAG: S-methyl-5'-thioadenosine phosphorylase [Zetaproteobacteria bacterium]|nr:MAG: S-methyl-5'-thioadenosine phosphorylase [Zetaproteobacteria bacterium]